MAYCDADFGGSLDTRRLTTGYVFTFGGGAISWSSRLQQTVATSTQEAEYQAAAGCAREALWIKKVLPELGYTVGEVCIGCDNTACLALLEDPLETQKSKHIDIVHHFVRERVQRKELKFEYVASNENVADVFTKPLSKEQFLKLKEGLGVS